MISLSSKNLSQVKLARKYSKTNAGFILSLFAGFLGLMLFILLFLNIINSLNAPILGISFLLIAIGLVAVVFKFFVSFGLREIKVSGDLKSAIESNSNLIEYCDFDALDAIAEGIDFANDKKIAVFDSIVLIIGLAYSKRGKFIMARLGYDFVKFNDYFFGFIAELEKGKLSKTDESADNALKLAAENAIKNNRNQIQIGDLFLGAAQADKFSKKVLFDLNLQTEDLENVVNWEKRIGDQIEYNRMFWIKDLKERTGGIGQDWAAGWTPNLLIFAQPVRATNIFSTYENSAHKDEIDELERILSRQSKNNVVLVGQSGVGKKTIVYGLADKIVKGQTMAALKNKHIYVLDVGAIISGAGPGEIERRLRSCLSDSANAGNVVLFIDGFEALIGGEIQKVGSVDASNVIRPYLERSGLQIITTVSLNDFHNLFEQNQILTGYFEKITVNEPSAQKTISILEDHILETEYYNKVFFNFPALKKIVELSGKYIHNKLFPAKALDIASEIAVSASTKEDKVITPEFVENLISLKVKIPTAQLQKTEKDKLLNLESVLHQRVVNQEEAVKAVSSAMRRARTGLSAQNRPLGSFLFLGPTGVGKTETAKALAEAYFGAEQEIIRLDMSEYQDAQAIYKLIGSPPGSIGESTEGGFLTKQVLDKPFALILLDEAEKTHPDVLNLFLQVLDDGRLTDNIGRTIDFTNTIIIATSNAGAELIRQEIKAGKSYQIIKENLMEYLQKNHIFRPEFLNRFDGVITFEPLAMDKVIEIAKLMIAKLEKELFSQKQIKLQVEEPAIIKLAQLGYDPTYGARPLRRVIQEKLENKIASMILSDKLPKGSELVIGEKDI